MPAIVPIRQVEIEQLCVSVFFIHGPNILWAGAGNAVHSQGLVWVAKATHNISQLLQGSGKAEEVVNNLKLKDGVGLHKTSVFGAGDGCHS